MICNGTKMRKYQGKGTITFWPKYTLRTFLHYPVHFFQIMKRYETKLATKQSLINFLKEKLLYIFSP